MTISKSDYAIIWREAFGFLEKLGELFGPAISWVYFDVSNEGYA